MVCCVHVVHRHECAEVRACMSTDAKGLAEDIECLPSLLFILVP